MPRENDRYRAALSLLGMARRAGAAVVGQDKAFACPSGEMMFIMTGDRSDAVARKAAARGRAVLTAVGLTREELGRAVGAASTQIVALPADSGFAKRVSELLETEGAYK